MQHALRAFTPDDLQVVRATAQTFPTTTFYKVETELTSLGIGEALITALSPKGVPMPTVHTMMRPPMSLMAQLDPPEEGVDWGGVAREGARIARSGAFNTVLRGVLGVLAGGSRRR